MLRSVFCSATYVPPCLGLLSQRDAVGQEYLAIEVEIEGLGPLEQLDHDLGVLDGRLQDVLLGPVVEDELHRKRPVLPATVLGPGDLYVSYLTHPYRLFGVLLRH